MRPFWIPFSWLFFLLIAQPGLAYAQSNSDLLPQLKDGVLLVQLNTEQKKLEQMRDRGFFKEATAREHELKREHYEIIQAFTIGFDFCPTYFFYADEAEEIVKGNIKETIRDENLRLVALEPAFFLIARFGYTPGRGLPGLLVYNQDLEYLEKDFPGFAAKNIIPILAVRSKIRMVELLNKKMHAAYASSQ